MKPLHILLCTISLLQYLEGNSQQVSDTIVDKQYYGLRLGIDLSKPITSLVENNHKAFEIQGDMRLANSYYAVMAMGHTDKHGTEDYLDFTTKGSYFKVGVNYNAYKNWTGMRNEVFIGLRYGMSLFKQTLNSFSPNSHGSYFDTDLLTPMTDYKDLSAHWVSLAFGMKVETFKNLFLGTTVEVNKMIASTEPDNFKNLYVPGFQRVYENNMGISFTYSLSYLIPLIKKTRKIVVSP